MQRRKCHDAQTDRPRKTDKSTVTQAKIVRNNCFSRRALERGLLPKLVANFPPGKNRDHPRDDSQGTTDRRTVRTDTVRTEKKEDEETKTTWMLILGRKRKCATVNYGVWVIRFFFHP